jgi:two-component system, OmpR family, phosphate regulon sensor histidine kinase PhoR
MNLILLRVASALTAMAIGALIGWIAGSLLRWPHLGAMVGASLTLTVVALRDAGKGRQLRAWLRGAQEQPAPRDTGFWGELGYRVERALRMRERETEQEQTRLRQFLSAIEASPNGVMMLDANEQIAWCNSQAADHFGIDPERDRLQRVTNLVRSPAFVAHLQSGSHAEPVTFTSPRGRGSLSVLVRPYGEGMKLVLSQDITERERTDAMRRDFVANVSHEIRTPLTVLSGFVETLATVPLTASERPRVLSLMRQQTDRIQALVDDLLTLAQLEGGPLPAADRWVEIDAGLQTVLADAQALSGGHHVISLEAQAGCQVAGIETELVSAMGNLVSNAVRYTPDGGSIQIHWRVREGDGCAEFEVRDSGIGIDRDHLPRLTERFYRVDGSRSRDTGGTGLGLAIVKHVVQRHGGELDIQSEPGKGSSFKLVFPAARVRTGVPGAGVLPAAATASAQAA